MVTEITKPLATDETLQAIATVLTNMGLAKIGNLSSLTTTNKSSIVAAINEVNAKQGGVQSDWNQTDDTQLDFIKNKPTLGTAASKNVGTASGVAELDEYGKIISSQLPSYVDDVIEGYYKEDDGKFYEESTFETEITPESGKIYTDLGHDVTYRWGGSTYVAIGSSLALGETSSTAYRGDRGKAAYDHASDSSKVSQASNTGLYKVGFTAEGHISEATAVLKGDITALGIPGSDTTYGVVSKTANGLAPQLPNESTTEKYLRQDGTWVKPPNDNTTYNFSGVSFTSGDASNAGHDANSITGNGHYYYNSNGPAASKGAQSNDGALYVQSYSSSWVGQIAQDFRNGNLFVRGKNSGTWQEWSPVASGRQIGWARYGTTSSTTKIKINIKPTAGWMLAFTVTLYQSYRAIKIMVSGYQYGSNHWYSPSAVILGDSGHGSTNVYFGYDSNNNLWVGFDGGNYTGVCISDICNGYNQLTDLGEMFTISNVSSLTTLQTTITLQDVAVSLVT